MNLIKLLLCFFAGIFIFNKITYMIFGEGVFIIILTFFFGYLWMSYLIKYYFSFSQMKDEENE